MRTIAEMIPEIMRGARSFDVSFSPYHDAVLRLRDLRLADDTLEAMGRTYGTTSVFLSLDGPEAEASLAQMVIARAELPTNEESGQ